jgi:hypothetical protein
MMRPTSSARSRSQSPVSFVSQVLAGLCGALPGGVAAGGLAYGLLVADACRRQISLGDTNYEGAGVVILHAAYLGAALGLILGVWLARRLRATRSAR